MKKALRGAAERAEARIDDKKKAKTESRHKAAGPRGVRRLGPPDESAASLAESALAALLKFAEPADVVLRRFFAAHPQMGRTDRGRVAEQMYDILRHRRLYAHLAQSGQGSLPARLIAVHEARDRIDAQGMLPEVRLSLPAWLASRLSATLSPAEFESLGRALLEPAPLDLRVNLLKTDPAAARQSLADEGVPSAPFALAPLALRVHGKPALERTQAFVQGHVEVQDAGSQLLAHLAAPRRGQTVVDFCAGAGGKTLALAALLRGSGQVFACDISAARLARLRPRLARSGATNVQPFGIDNEHDAKLDRLAGRADVVLVDAPCSGTGTLRRNPDLKWRFDPASLAALGVTQRSILAAAAQLVRPGGALVYATCSLLDEENDAVRRDFERDHPGWQVEPAVTVLARQGIELSPLLDPQALVLRTDVHGTDAFYAVRWLRPA
jgi:16S rRNA (cytosine967-C5)-methyltransferase